MNEIQDLLSTLDTCQRAIGSSGTGAHSKNLQVMRDMLTTIFSGGLADDGAHRRGGNPALRAQQTICRLIMTNATDFIAICDEDGHIQFANASSLHVLGYNPASLLSKPLLQVVHHEDVSEASRYWQKLLETGHAQGTMRYRHSNGSTRWLEVNGTSFRLSTGCQVVLVSRDVTERKQAEDSLRESEQLNRLITDSVADLISIVNQEGRLVYISPSYSRSLGFESQMLLGSLAFDFMHPDDIPVMMECIQQLFGPDSDRGMRQSSVRHRHVDGSWRWLEAHLRAISLSTGEAYRSTNTRILIVSRDITARRQEEERSLVLDRLKSLGMISSGIAHDFANMLSAVIGNLRLSEMLIPVEGHEEFRTSIEQALRAARNAVDLAKQITAFARDRHQDCTYLNLSALAGDMIAMLRASISRNVSLSHSLRVDIPLIEGNVTQVGQIVLNLVLNAAEAVFDDFGGIHISTGVRSITQAELKSQNMWFGDELGDRDCVFLEVTDTGSGITPEILSQIFEPFFTTKVAGRGLGLATVLQIIRSHGGALNVQSKVGMGTTFTVFFLPIDGHSHVTRSAFSDAVAHIPIEQRSSQLDEVVGATLM
jgi:two-component system, cell cycle sensor histidine kinase and response regulator CckA